MKSLSKKLANVEQIKSSSLTSWTSFYAYRDGRWDTITDSEFNNAMYTGLFIKDEEASSSHQSVFVRK